MKAPKTRNGVRDVPIHPHLVPLLRRMAHGRAPDALVVPLMSAWYEDARAKRTREHLAKAGVTRPRLTENTATTMMVGFRSWRDTGITWLALAGVDVAKMQRRAGHDEISTTMGYVKSAEDISGTIGEPFPPLPDALLRPGDEGAAGGDTGSGGRATLGHQPSEQPTSHSGFPQAAEIRGERCGEGGIRTRGQVSPTHA